MAILINYSFEGFQNLKKSQTEIDKRINKVQAELKRLNRMKAEFIYAYYQIKNFFEPTVSIVEDGSIYVGEFTISHPREATYKITIGEIESFKGVTLESLQMEAQKLALEKLQIDFPTYF